MIDENGANHGRSNWERRSTHVLSTPPLEPMNMDRSKRLVSGAWIGLPILLLVPCAHAQFGPPPDGPGEGRDGPRFQDIELMAEFDVDGDERLDRSERDAARAALAERPRRERRGGPGGRRGGRGGPGGEDQLDGPRPHESPDALQLESNDVEHFPKNGLYDTDVLHTLFFEFDEDDWHEELAAFHETDVEVPGRLILDDQLIGEVGISYRGNTSYQHAFKKSFGVSIDAYDNDLRLKGYRTLNLLNSNGDDSMMREVLFSNIARKYMPAPRANFVKVVVNGTYLGVYANVQQINKDFLAENYDTKDGVRWKVPPDFSGHSALAYHGDSIDDYVNGYELKTASADDEDWADLIELCRILRETPDEDLERILPKYLDVDEAIRFLALDNVFMDSDGYYSRGSDYYVFKDPEGVFHLLHYDNNETFGGHRGRPQGGGGPDDFGPPPDGRPGGFMPDDVRRRPGLDRPRRRRDRERDDRRARDIDLSPPGQGAGDFQRQRNRRGRGPGGGGGGGGGPTQSPLAYENDLETRPLIVRILAVPAWRDQYLDMVRELAEVELDWNSLGRRVMEYRALIVDAVAQDPFDPDRITFLESLDGNDRSLKSIARQRRDFLLQHESLGEPNAR